MTIQTVAMNKPRGHAPRLSVPYDPDKPRARRFWTDDELAIVKTHYGKKGGPDICRRLLPERTRLSIFQAAQKLGVHAIAHGAARRRIAMTPMLEKAIRERWPSLTAKGAVTAFAEELGMPKHTLLRHAARFGLTHQQRKEPPWSEAETALMSRVPLHSPEKAAQIFREHGFNRTATAIVVRAKRLDLSRRYKATLSAAGAAKILGVDNKTVTLWCIQGLLKASKRPTRRLPQQGGDPWSIERADLRRFVLDQLASIDIRKVDKVAFVDLLVNVGGEQGGGARPPKPRRRRDDMTKPAPLHLQGEGIAVVWRENRRQPWQDAELLADHDSGGLVLRESGRLWPGVWIADRADVRIAGPEFEGRA